MMMDMSVRNLARQLFHRAGAIKLVRFRTRHLLKVLMYHHFPAGTEADFERHCIHIRRYYHPIDVDALVAWIKNPAPPMPKMVPPMTYTEVDAVARYVEQMKASGTP